MTYQRNRLITLLDNYNDSLKNYEAALNSAGTAEQKFAIYQENTRAALDKFTATWEEMWQHTLSSDTIKTIINLGTVILNLVDKIGLLPVALSTAFSSLFLFNKSFQTFATNIAPIVLQKLGLIVATENGIAIAANGAALSVKRLSLAFTTFAPLVIAGAIYGLVKAFDALNVSLEEYKNSVDESYNKAQSNIEQLKQWQKEYEGLANKTELTRDEKAKLIEIERQLKTKFGETAQAIDLQNGSLETNIDLMQQLTKEEAERFILLNERAYREAKKTLEGPYTMSFQSGDFIQFENIEEAIKEMEEAVRDAVDKSNIVYNTRKKILEDLYKEYDNATDIVSKYEGYEKLLQQTVDETNDSINENSDSFQNYEDNFEKLNDIIDSVQSDLKTLNQILDDVQNGQSLNAETVLDLIQKHKELIPAIHKTADGWTIEKDAIENLRKATIENILKIGELKEQSKKLLELLSDPNFGVSSSKSSSSKSTPFSEQFDFINTKIKSLNQELKELQQQLDDTFSPAGKQTIIDKMIVAQQKKADLLKKAIKTYEDSAQKELQKIPESLRSAVVSGSFNIVTISEEIYGEERAKEISEAIKQYQSLMDTIIGLKNEYAEIDNTIRSLDLDKIVLSFEVFDKKIKESDRALEELDYQLNLLGENDYDKKAELIDKKIEVTTKQVNEYEQELERLKAIVPTNAEEAEKLQERIDELTKKFREGKISIKEYNDTKITLSFEKFDDKIKESDRALEELDYQLNLLGENDFDRKAELIGKKIEITTSQVNEYEQELERLKAIVPANAEEAERLQERIDEVTKKIREGKISIKEYNDTLEETAKNSFSTLLNTPKDIDKKIRESDRALEELDYQLNLLKDNDYDKKAEILTKKIEVATKQVNEYAEELERLKAIVPTNAEEAEKLQERIDEVTKKFREGKVSIKEYNDILEETAKSLVSTLLNTQKDIDKKNLDNQLKEREKQIYDITEAEFEAYKKAKIESLKKQKEENEKIATDEAKELVRLLTEQIKLEESISYKDIVNFGDLYKEIHNEKIKQYQDTIDMLERSNELEQQRLEREERILEIQELQLKLQNTLNNRNVQILRKKEDGSWEYDYVADPEKVEELQKQIAEKQKDFDEWEGNNSLKQTKELLQQKIEQERELIRISEETYNKIAEIETTKFNKHYENMDILAENALEDLKTTYSNKWDEIIEVLQEKVRIAEQEYAKLLGASVAGVSVQTPNTNITTQTSSTGEAVGGNTNTNITTQTSSTGEAVGGDTNTNITAQTPSTGFGTTPTAESETYIRQLKEAVGGDREAFRQTEIARAEQVIANRKAQGLDTSAQEDYLKTLLDNTFKFKEGGIVDYTGLAWVDGSKSKPEAFLDSTDTKLFSKFVDFLPNMTNILNNWLIPKMNVPSLSKVSTSSEVKQIFNISKLEFPNVKSADDIKEAILDLPRLSLQMAKAQ